MQELVQQIAKDLAKGRKKRQIVEELSNDGMDKETAKQLVNKVNKQVQKAISDAQFEKLRPTYRKIGITFMILGVGGFLLPFLGLDFEMFERVLDLGNSTLNIIKLTFLVMGVALFFLGRPEF